MRPSPHRITIGLSVLSLLLPSLATAQYGNYGGAPQATYESDSPERGNRLRRGKLFLPTFDAAGDYRQPQSIVMWGNDRALVSTKLTGEIYQLDLLNHHIQAVVRDEARQFGPLLLVADDLLVIADTRNEEVVTYRWSAESQQWTIAATAPVLGQPHSLYYDADHACLWVSSRWGQRLHGLQLKRQANEQPEWISIAAIDLPMCGGKLLGLPQQHLILVADAHGREFAMIDTNDQKVVQHQQLYEHNVSGMVALDDGKAILFAHQLLHDVVPAVQNHITWGTFISNSLRLVQTEAMRSGTGKEIYRGSQFIPVGQVRNGAADPTSLAMTADQQIAITVGGTGQVAIGSLGGVHFEMVDVGPRPIDCVFTPNGKTLLVVSQFSDSISIIEMESESKKLKPKPKPKHLTLGKVRPPTNRERGEQLFHDATLAHDGWMSCQSCHTDGHTTGLLADNFTDNSYDSPKRVLSLLGQADTAPYSWTGKLAELEQQIVVSIESTMASDHPAADSDVRQLAEFVRSLTPPPSLYQSRPDAYSAAYHQVELGGQVFIRAGCADCHSGSQFTSDGAYDVGLVDEQGETQFNPPSLLGISQRQNALFHDASATSIRDVVVQKRHQLPDDVSPEQAEALVHFLKSL